MYVAGGVAACQHLVMYVGPLFSVVYNVLGIHNALIKLHGGS